MKVAKSEESKKPERKRAAPAPKKATSMSGTKSTSMNPNSSPSSKTSSKTSLSAAGADVGSTRTATVIALKAPTSASEIVKAKVRRARELNKAKRGPLSKAVV